MSEDALKKEKVVEADKKKVETAKKDAELKVEADKKANEEKEKEI